MSVIVGKTIDQLNAATAVTANDEVAIYDAEAGAAEVDAVPGADVLAVGQHDVRPEAGEGGLQAGGGIFR